MCNEIYNVIIRSSDYVSGTQYTNIKVNVGAFLPQQSTQKYLCRVVQFSNVGADALSHDFLEIRADFNAPNTLDTGSGTGTSLVIMPTETISTGITTLDFNAPRTVIVNPTAPQWTITLTQGITQAVADIDTDWVLVLEFTPLTYKNLDYGQIM